MTDDDGDTGATPTPTPAEAAALALLDRRAHLAAVSLRAAVAARPDRDDHATPHPPIAGDTGDPGTGPDAVTEVVLLRSPDDGTPGTPGGPPVPAARPRPRRRLRLAAAAAAVVAVGAAAVIGLRDDEPPGVTSGDQPYLLPGWLPQGFEPVSAVRGEPGGGPVAGGAEVVVYGDPDAADPWARTIAVTFVAGDDREAPTEGDRGEEEQVVVGGRTATLTDREGLQVDWAVDGGRLTVMGSEAITRAELLAAAAGASSAPAIGPEALPAGFADLAHGPQYAAGYRFRSPAGLPAGGVLVAYVRDPRAATSDGPQLAVAQRPGGEAAVDLIRLGAETSWAAEVGGRHAVGVASLDQGPDREVALQWLDPSGLLVTVASVGLTDDELVRVAEGLRPAGRDEIDGLLRAYDARVASTEVEAGLGWATPTEGEVAAGEQGGAAWRLVADGESGEPGEVTLDLRFGDGSVAMGWSDGTSDTASSLEVSWSQSAGWPQPALFGVAAGAATVTVEVAGHQVASPELHAVPGRDGRAFVVFLPPGTTGEVVVTARDAGGVEVGRDSGVL